MTTATLATAGYGTGGSIAGVVREGYATAALAHASLATFGYGSGASIAAVVRDGYSGFVNLPITVPAGKQAVVVAGLPWTPPARSILEGASPAVANGDIIICDLVSTPNGYAITMSPDGTFSIATGTDTSRQSFAADVYRLVGGTYDGVFTNWVNNRTPSQVQGLNLPAFTTGIAITPIDLSAYFLDIEADGLTYQVVAGALPDGLSLAGSIISGTPRIDGAFSATVRVTDITGEYVDAVISGSNLTIGVIRFYNWDLHQQLLVLESGGNAGTGVCFSINTGISEAARNDILRGLKALERYISTIARWPPN